MGNPFEQFANWAGGGISQAFNAATGNTFGTGGFKKLYDATQANKRLEAEANLAHAALLADSTQGAHRIEGALFGAATGPNAYEAADAFFADALKGVNDVSKVFDVSTPRNRIDNFVSQLQKQGRSPTQIAHELTVIGNALQAQGGPDTLVESPRASDSKYYFEAAAAQLEPMTLADPGAVSTSDPNETVPTTLLGTGGAEGTPHPPTNPPGSSNFPWWKAFVRGG